MQGHFPNRRGQCLNRQGLRLPMTRSLSCQLVLGPVPSVGGSVLTGGDAVPSGAGGNAVPSGAGGARLGTD